MTGRLQGRTAFITGASSGLGRAIALRFANEGANIFVADLYPAPRIVKVDGGQPQAQDVRDTSTAATHDQINDVHGKNRAAFATCNVTSEETIADAVQSCVSTFGRVDIVVACAGIAIEGTRENLGVLRAHETSVEDWDLTQSINARGVFLTCKHGIAQMLKQEPLQGSKERGWVVNLASIKGLVASGGISSYCASKGAVVSMTKAMAIEYAPERIHVNCLCPGYVQTTLTQQIVGRPELKALIDSRHPLGGMAENPDVIAKAAVFLASDDAEWITGVPLPVDGGYVAQ